MGRHRFDEDKAGQWGGPALAGRDTPRQRPSRHAAEHAVAVEHAVVDGSGGDGGDEGVPPPQ